jgi:hypothetical protein
MHKGGPYVCATFELLMSGVDLDVDQSKFSDCEILVTFGNFFLISFLHVIHYRVKML